MTSTILKAYFNNWFQLNHKYHIPSSDLNYNFYIDSDGHNNVLENLLVKKRKAAGKLITERDKKQAF